MKKLLTLCLLLATTFTALAQEKKPTKEETVAFMNKTLNNTIGFSDGRVGKISEVQFDGNSFILRGYSELIEGYATEKWTGINWESLNSEGFTLLSNRLSVRFNRNFNRKQKIKDQPEKELFTSQLDFKLPIEKIESFKKACIRLSEIAKEENKDPFAN